MKKFLLMVFLTLTAIIKVSAQMEVKGAIDGDHQHYSSIAIPSEFCKDTTPFITLEKSRNYDNNSFVILNENLETVKEVSLNRDLQFSYQLTYQEKTRQVKSVTEKGKVEEELSYSWQEVMQREMNFNYTLTPESFIYDVQENGDSIIHINTTNSDFTHNLYFGYDYFGDKYPRSYWRCSKGKVYQVRTSYQVEYTDWTDAGTRTEDRTKSTLPISIRYINLNNSNEGTNFEFYLTQTLFNQDDNFEYIIPKYTIINSSSSTSDPTPEYYGGDDENISLSSESLISPSTVALSGFKVVNEEGDVISESDFSSPFETYNSDVDYTFLIRIGSKLYLAFEGRDANGDYATYFYEINNTTSAIKQVKAVSLGMNIINNNDNYQSHSFNITFKDGNQKASELIATSATGAILSKVNVPQGQTSTKVNVVSPKGIAIITRYQNGKAIESKKVELK